jgi:Leucine-rich repeat (LRR) protein
VNYALTAEDSIPDVVMSLSSLRALDISHNNVATVPDHFFSSLSALEKLDLSHNRIRTLPPGIRCMTRLRVLTLSHNAALNALPEDFFELDALAELYLRYTASLTTVCRVCVCVRLSIARIQQTLQPGVHG